jgi:uroporphyrinogen-III synthase
MTATATDPPIFDVVVTRDAGRCGELATLLAAHGARVVALPLTRTRAADPADLVRGTRIVGPGDTVVVASARAAEALAAAGVRNLAARVIAVGAATAEALVAAGVAATVEQPARADAIGLAEHVLAADPRPGRVVWPRAASGREEGIERLRAAGVAVDAPVAYHTEATPADDPALGEGLAAIIGARAAVIAFYAPSQVDALIALLGGAPALAAARLVAIGETTADALRAHGARVDAVAATPDARAMASAIAAVYPGSR